MGEGYTVLLYVWREESRVEEGGIEVFDRRGVKERMVGTGSDSVQTVNITHLLRRSQTGDAEDPWGS